MCPIFGMELTQAPNDCGKTWFDGMTHDCYLDQGHEGECVCCWCCEGYPHKEEDSTEYDELVRQYLEDVVVQENIDEGVNIRKMLKQINS